MYFGQSLKPCIKKSLIIYSPREKHHKSLEEIYQNSPLTKQLIDSEIHRIADKEI